MTEETKQKISETLKRKGIRPPVIFDRTGHHHSKETKTKMSAARKGIIFTDEHIANMSKAQIGKPSPMKGKKHTPESIEKMKAALKGRIGSNNGKKFSEEYRKKLSEARLKNPQRYWLGKKREDLSGKNNPRWKGGYDNKLMNNKNRRALKKNSIGTHTVEEWNDLKARYEYTCLCCGRKEPEIKLTEDHIVPLTKKGDNTIGNIQPLCLSCNSKKRTKIIDYRLKLAI